jgi:hypothetical protein
MRRPTIPRGIGRGWAARLDHWARFRPSDSRVTGSNLAQALVTVLVALAVAVGTLVSASAAGRWQSSLRQEIKRAAGTIETVRHVYGDEAPLAFERALTEARAEAFEGGDAETEREVLFAARTAGRGADHLIGDRYARPDGSYAVGRRLAELERRSPETVRLDPDATLAAGDRRSRLAGAVMAATIPLVAAFVVADLILRRRQRRRPPDTRATTTEPAELDAVPRPWASAVERRTWVAVAFAAWLLVTLLPALQIHLTNQEQRAEALSARKASQVSTMLAAGGQLSTFRAGTMQRILALETHSLGRSIAAADARTTSRRSGLLADARAEKVVAARARAIGAAMSAAPTAEDGVAPATLEVVNAPLAAARAMVGEQNAEVDRAEAAGTRAGRVTLALLLGALAGALCLLAGAAWAHKPSAIDLAAAAVVAAAVLVVASVPLA